MTRRTEFDSPAAASTQRVSLRTYVRIRNGVPLGGGGSLRNMLHRSLGAATFANFWQHWNPIFGYALSKHVYSPFLRVVPRPVALVATFVICGALHDLVTMAVRGSPAFFFTPWFFALGLGVLVGQASNMNLAHKPWGVRAIANLVYIAASLALSLFGVSYAARP